MFGHKTSLIQLHTRIRHCFIFKSGKLNVEFKSSIISHHITHLPGLDNITKSSQEYISLHRNYGTSATILTCTYMHVCLLDRRMHHCSSQASRHRWRLLTAFLAPEKESKQKILVTLNQKVYPHHHKIVADHHTEAKYYELMISRHGHDSAT